MSANEATTHERAKLSVTIITKNEAKHIRACIESCRFADEILVVDSGSDDDTVAIAQSLGARVMHQNWLGYGAQKHFSVEAAVHDWVLCLDADERVDATLANEIVAALSSSKSFAYELPMQQRFMNRMLNHGDGFPLWKLRLFHRKHAQWSNDPIHESVKTNQKPSRLRGKLLHLPELTLHDWIAKQNHYTTLQAEHLFARGKTASVGSLIASPLWRFLKYYVFQLGFLDGVPGLVHAALNAAFVFSKYAKLWSLQQRDRET
jgi:glycosyltransferase involved in cell wall biosynthesis